MKTVQNYTMEKLANLIAGVQPRALLPTTITQTVGTERTKLSVTQIRDYLLDPARRRKILLVWWAFLVFLCIIGSVIVMVTAKYYFHAPRTGIYATITIWAFLFAYFTYFFANEKIVATFFGAAIGVGSSDSVSGSGIVTKIADEIKLIAARIKDDYGVVVAADVGEVRVMLLFFVFLYGVLCAPVFLLKEQP